MSWIEVANVDYEGVAGALTGVEGTTSTPLTMDSGLGSPPVSNVVVGGGSLPATGVEGSLSSLERPPTRSFPAIVMETPLSTLLISFGAWLDCSRLDQRLTVRLHVT